MSAHNIALRASCLTERARACVAGFERLGKRFSADLTRQMLNALECGAPACLYDHWIGEQETRLASMQATHTSPVFAAAHDARIAEQRATPLPAWGIRIVGENGRG